MKGKFSRLTLLLILVAMVLTSVLVPMQAFAGTATGYTSANDVVYNTNGKYIYNWGARGERATFLSKYALQFYTGSYTFDNLSKVSGGSSESNAPSSGLYKQLQDLMKSKHTYINGYSENNNLLQYTDCENGGGTISSFYSGKAIGPSWGVGGWNKEHTWPNSKGLGGADEDDVMMIRPTATSENSSRGNTAYGESSGYYNPNSESGGKYDLRGDCARIFLYVYTRWGNTNGNGSYSTWGTRGVMESLEVLLKWMEQDPVDTWEMGRNDAVQAITGTRNVFVDYPEYAWLLFGEAVPSNYATPSGSNGVTPPKPEDCTHTFSPATCTEPQTCTKCWTTQGAALGHTAPNNEGLCDRCDKVLDLKTTHAGTQSDPYTIADAIKVAQTITSGGSSDKVYVKGQVVNAGEVVSNKYRKGLTIKDSSTNATLYINTANPKSTTDLQLNVGETILLEGYIRISNSTQQAEMGTGNGGNYTYYSIVAGDQGGDQTHTHSFGQATCTKPATCSCGETQGNALGHTTTNGTCSRCGTVVGGGGSVTPPSGETISVNFQNSTGSTSINSTGSVKFTASRAVDNWDDGTRGIQFLKEKGTVTVTSATSVNNVSSITLDISENKSINITVTVKVGNTVLTCNGSNSATVGKGNNQKITFTASSAVSGVITIEMVPAKSGTSGLGSMWLASLQIETASDVPTHTHSFSQATCTKPATCSCGETQGTALGHSFSQATCTEPAKCSCGETQGNALGHNEVIDQAVSATCTTAGKTEGKHCSRCDTVLQAQTTIPATGHTVPNAEGKCDTCGTQLVDMQLAINNFKSAVANVQSATTLQSKFNAIKVAVSAYDSLNSIQKAQVTTELATLKTQIESYNAEISKQNENSNNALAIAGASIVAVAAVALMLLKKVF